MKSPQVDDQSLAAHFARRAGRAKLTAADRDRLLANVSAASAQSTIRWKWGPAAAFLPLAAVLVVGVVIATAILARAPVGPNGSSPSASSGPTASTSALGRVLTTVELQAALDASAFNQGDRTVIADASIDRTAIHGRLGPLCFAESTCLIGALSGVRPPPDRSEVLVQAGPDVRSALPSSGTAVFGWLALAIHGRETVELLGVVEPNAAGDLDWPPSETGVSGALEADGAHVIAVTGWLARTNMYIAYDCYIRPGSPPPTDSPFEGCGAAAWIASDSTKGLLSAPFTSIKVQLAAYSSFAPDPEVAAIGSDGTVEPRFATYLLRVIVDPNCGPTQCRGWRVIGTLTSATSAPSPSLSPSPTLTSGTSAPPSPAPSPTASSAVLTLRTFPVWHEENGIPVECDAIGVDNPVFGHLEGDPGRPQEPVWLRASDGTRFSIVWPEGFTAVIANGAIAVADETGTVRPRTIPTTRPASWRLASSHRRTSAKG